MRKNAIEYYKKYKIFKISMNGAGITKGLSHLDAEIAAKKSHKMAKSVGFADGLPHIYGKKSKI